VRTERTNNHTASVGPNHSNILRY